MQSGFRADIDGLRAIAILPVLFFHAGISTFSGGYVGVDIFFVISGYLITGILVREIDGKSFSIARFYERRARRILPALLLVIAVVLAVSALIDLPTDFESVGESALAATLFVSNVYFYTDIDYFSRAADTKPLLHTWSLSVEEQFYIGFPLFLMLVARFAPAIRAWAVGLIAILSLGLAIVMQGDQTGFNFYMLPTRAWELMIGALLALGVVPPISNRAAREAAAAVGCAAIALSVFVFDSATPFPGVAALAPVLGSATLIHCAPGTAIGRVLGTAPLRGIGLISYSLYLWHWPLIVFVRRLTGQPLDAWDSAAIISGSIVLAVLSWRFVEQPFRRPGSVTSVKVLLQAGAGLASVGAFALAIVVSQGWPSRFSPSVLHMAQAEHDVSPFRRSCHDYNVDGDEPCTLGAKVKPSAVLWGDSHGVELSYAISQIARAEGWSLVQRTHSSCPPVIGYNMSKRSTCAQANRATFEAVTSDPAIQTVYLSAFWSSRGYRHLGPQLNATISALLEKGKRVVVIGPVPGAPFDVPRELARLARGQELATATGNARAEVLLRTEWFRSVVDPWRERVTVVDPMSHLCRGEKCDVIRDGQPLYFDSHHLSVAGARLIAEGGMRSMATAAPQIAATR